MSWPNLVSSWVYDFVKISPHNVFRYWVSYKDWGLKRKPNLLECLLKLSNKV